VAVERRGEKNFNNTEGNPRISNGIQGIHSIDKIVTEGANHIFGGNV